MHRQRALGKTSWLLLVSSPHGRPLLYRGLEEQQLYLQIVYYQLPSEDRYWALTPPILDLLHTKASCSDVETERILEQMNASVLFESALRCALGSATTSSQATYDSFDQALSWIRKLRVVVWSTRFVTYVLMLFVLALFCCATSAHYLLNFPLPSGIGPPKRFTVIGSQLDFRLRQMFRWPSIWIVLQGQRLDSHTRAHHLEFNSTILLALVDQLLGLAACAFIITYPALAHEYFAMVGELVASDFLSRNMAWLMGHPAGIKLNHELGSALGNVALHGIDLWRALYEVLQWMQPTLLLLFGVSGIFGVTILISLASDMLYCATIHVYLMCALRCALCGSCRL
jgi:hypothetical protein